MNTTTSHNIYFFEYVVSLIVGINSEALNLVKLENLANC